MGGWGSGYSRNEWGGSGTIDQCVDRFIARGPGKHCGNVKVGNLSLPGKVGPVIGFWSYRQPIAYWVPGAKRPTIALDCREFSMQTGQHRGAVEYAARKKRIPTICVALPFRRTYGGGRDSAFLSPGERWTAGSRSTPPRKVRSAVVAAERAFKRYLATHDEADYDEYRRLSETAYSLARPARKRLGDREAIRYAIAQAHARRMARLESRGEYKAEDWDPLTRKTIKP